ncbi:unnamed protein product [Rotaria sp. Silwood2]|nr:unnamed protein product [Rotaria sp. Silwood2]CAF2552813.1 unnamed protein product [Rotaria sp. Silwood2]CAF2774000.1 unnamed protein product [Rotaria sp. Silwood2]CAF2960603.1 unnamed protein product [Rotaria sp. Silwood2]CAF3882937.1 unnamed protein product [Rotaria sp. Silwood2]
MIVDSLKHATNECNIYGGFFLFFIGMIGNILNIIIFTSLKTFRETSAAFYMNVASTVNVFQLVVGLLSRILITGYDIDPTKTSSFFCKARQFTLITTMLIIFSCMCFATIDQFLLLTNRWRHLCNLQVASRLVIIAFIVCFLHGIPVLIFQDLYPPLGTGETTCSFTNNDYSIYYSRFLFPVLLGILPLIVRITFGLLAFINVRQLQNRQVPIVRLERDKQLTAMVLVEVVFDVIITLPYSIYNHWYSSTVKFSDPVSIAQNQLITSITRLIFYGNFSIPFYIYCSVSSRFRRQLVHVLTNIYFKCWQEHINRRQINRVAPRSIVEVNTVL